MLPGGGVHRRPAAFGKIAVSGWRPRRRGGRVTPGLKQTPPRPLPCEGRGSRAGQSPSPLRGGDRGGVFPRAQGAVMRYVYFTKMLRELDRAGLVTFCKEVGLDGLDLTV